MNIKLFAYVPNYHHRSVPECWFILTDASLIIFKFRFGKWLVKFILSLLFIQSSIFTADHDPRLSASGDKWWVSERDQSSCVIDNEINYDLLKHVMHDVSW